MRNEVVKGAVSIPKNIGTEVYKAARVYENERLKANLTELDIPKFAINSEELTNTDFETAKKYGLEVRTMKGVGHFVMMEDPETFNAILSDVLDQITGKNRS